MSDQDRSFAVLCCSSIWVLHIQVAGENVGCWCFWRTGSRLGWGGGYLDLVQGDQVVNAREGCKKNGGCSCRGNSSLTCMVFKHLLHHSFPKTERLAQHVDHIFCLLSICRLFFLLETSTKLLRSSVCSSSCHMASPTWPALYSKLLLHRTLGEYYICVKF